MSQDKPAIDPRQDGLPAWRIWAWVAVVLVFALLWAGPLRQEREPVRQLGYSELKQALREGRVQSVVFEGDTLRGILRPKAAEEGAEAGAGGPEAADAAGEKDAGDGGPASGEAGPEVAPGGGGAAGDQAAPDAGAGGSRTVPFVTTRPPVDDPELLRLLEQQGVAIEAEDPEPAWWLRSLVTLVPWLLILGLLFYAGYRMQQRMGQGPGGQLLKFGKSTAKRFREESTGVSFDDVAGAQNAKSDLAEIVGFLKDPQAYRSLGAKIPKGILLLGPPGTGKTLLAKAVAGEAGVPFYSISGSEFIEMFVGVGAARVRDTFESARKEAPAIIFIDEIDSVGRTRGAGLGGGHDEREQTLNQILGEMDGFEPHEAVVVLAATNRPDILDPALLRPGRFDRKVMLELPQREAREAILRVHTRDVPLADDVDLAAVAARTIGFSGADLENLVNEAALLAGREGRQEVDAESFTRARDKIVLGAVRERGMSDEEKRIVAYHESGHALMASLLPQADPLDKVTILPRGRALGATEQQPEEERYNLRQGYLEDRLGVMLGGRVAEQVVFDEVSSGAEQDLAQATRLARRMVGRWGMSEQLGPVAFKQGEEHVFLGREMTQQRDFSEHTARLLDEEVRSLLGRIEQRVRDLTEQHREGLDALAETLLERETVPREDLERILPG